MDLVGVAWPLICLQDLQVLVWILETGEILMYSQSNLRLMPEETPEEHKEHNHQAPQDHHYCHT